MGKLTGDVLGLWVENTGLFLGRAALVFFLVGYLFFALLIIRQVGLLNKLLGTPLSPVIKLLAWLHLLFALFVFVFSLYSLKVVG